MAALIFKPDTVDDKPKLLVDGSGNVLSAENVDDAVVVESCYVGYAVWEPGRVKHRVDDDTCYREADGETFAPCGACGGASFEFDSLNPNFSSAELDVDFPTALPVSYAKEVKVVIGPEHMSPICWDNYLSDGDKLVGYGMGVKELYDKAIEDLEKTMPNDGALTPPKKFCLTTEGTKDGEAIWFNMDGWQKDTPQIGLQPSSDAVLARTYVGIGAEIGKENYENLKDLDNARFEDGTLCYTYSVLGANGLTTDDKAAYNSVRWRLMSFPTVNAGAKVSFCVATELKVLGESNTRTKETAKAEESATSTDSGGYVKTTVTSKNTVVTQPLSALEGVPLMVYNLKEFKNEIEPGKETVWEFESCGNCVEGYCVPRAEWCCSINAWEYVKGGGESKITITVPESRTVMLGVESGCLWSQVTDFVKGAQASVSEEKSWQCNQTTGAFFSGYKEKEEHIAGGAYVWQTVTLVDNAEISFG